MPEGPQVYQIGQKLRAALLPERGALLKSIMITGHLSTELQAATSSATTDDDSFSSRDSDNVDLGVVKIITRGKRIAIILEDGEAILLRFAVSGFLEISDGPLTETEDTIAVMRFSSGEEGLTVTLRDPRRLASAVMRDARTILTTMMPQGFDPLHTVAGMREWFALCDKHREQLVAKFLTDQNVIAGIGNRFRSEIMHASKISPLDARVRDMSVEKLEIMLVNIYRILKMASRGEYEYAVYGRKTAYPTGEPVGRVRIGAGVTLWTTFDNAKKAQKSVRTAGTGDSVSVRRSAHTGRILRQ